METKFIPQLLLVAGAGRNTGKTTFICNIIRKFSKAHSIVSLKITPHFHKNVNSGKVIVSRDDLYIAEETDFTSAKDSSLMLQAGALRSYFIMAKDAQLVTALEEIEKLLVPDSLVVCESGGLRDLVVPGLFFMMCKKGEISSKPGVAHMQLMANRVITFDGQGIDFDLQNIEIINNQWNLNDQP